MTSPLSIRDSIVEGLYALPVPPGTRAADIEKLLREAMTDDLLKAADSLGAVLGAPTESFSRPKPGRDGDGRTVFEICGRVEGGRLVPSHRAPRRRR